MEYVDIREDTGVKRLRLLQRAPFDVHTPIEGFRLQVNDSDLVAAIDIEILLCGGLLNLFDPHVKPPYFRTWTSHDGDWQLDIECDENGRRIVTSHVTSQLLHHPWFVRTSLEIERDDFDEICESVRSFIGVTE